MNKMTKFVSMLKTIKNNLPIEFQIVLSGVGVCGHALYSFTTLKRDTIEIDKKYKFTQNSNTQFMIIDKNNKHYNVNNSFWYWKWDSIEDWNTLRENDTIKIKYYGFRIPIFGAFPNIISSKDNSISISPTKNNVKNDDENDIFKNYLYL